MSEPTPEQLREKVARLMGWEALYWEGNVLRGKHSDITKMPPGMEFGFVPDYSIDLNAFDQDCKPWIDERRLRVEWTFALERIMRLDPTSNPLGRYTEVNASAYQRCLALLECAR